jgi:hypothetical protein
LHVEVVVVSGVAGAVFTVVVVAAATATPAATASAIAVVLAAVTVTPAVTASVAITYAAAASSSDRGRAPLGGASKERCRRNRHRGAPRVRSRALNG